MKTLWVIVLLCLAVPACAEESKEQPKAEVHFFVENDLCVFTVGKHLYALDITDGVMYSLGIHASDPNLRGITISGWRKISRLSGLKDDAVYITDSDGNLPLDAKPIMNCKYGIDYIRNPSGILIMLCQDNQEE